MLLGILAVGEVKCHVRSITTQRLLFNGGGGGEEALLEREKPYGERKAQIP